MANIRNITVRGARQHNLKSVDVEIPRNQLTVITGLSGSGKSSLAFDTIYAEGQRRYVESLSAYARQFLDRLEPPDVDSIEGLSPAISIEQKTASRSPRSTVGTVTEIYDYLRLLFSSIGIPHCYECGKPISKQTPDQIVRHLKVSAGGRAGHDPRADRPRPEGRVQETAAGAGTKRVRPRPHRRRSAQSGRADRTRQEEKPHDRNRRRPPADQERHR